MKIDKSMVGRKVRAPMSPEKWVTILAVGHHSFYGRNNHGEEDAYCVLEGWEFYEEPKLEKKPSMVALEATHGIAFSCDDPLNFRLEDSAVYANKRIDVILHLMDQEFEKRAK